MAPPTQARAQRFPLLAAAAPLLLALLAASCSAAQAAEALPEATPAAQSLALGGDRLVFHGRKASAIWRAAANSVVPPAPGTQPAANSSSLALRFGRLAELHNTTGNVVRRVSSLARVTPTQISSGALFLDYF